MSIINSGIGITNAKINGYPNNYENIPCQSIRATSYGTNGVKSIGIGTNTYSAAIQTSTYALSPTDLLVISGSALKKIYVTKVIISGTVVFTSNTFLVPFYLIKRSTLNTSGTPQNVIPQKNYVNDPYSVAKINYYSTAPTPGSAVGNIWCGYFNVAGDGATSIDSSNGVGNAIVINLSDIYGQPVVLNNANESLAVGLNGFTLTSAIVVNITLQWTEI